jgi:hypothetical protein
MAAGATHTDFHVNLQYFSNEQIVPPFRYFEGEFPEGAVIVFPQDITERGNLLGRSA